MADLSGKMGDRDIDAGRVFLRLGDVETTARESLLELMGFEGGVRSVLLVGVSVEIDLGFFSSEMSIREE